MDTDLSALFEHPARLNAKILEHALEVTLASGRNEVARECAGLLYFIAKRMQAAGMPLGDVVALIEVAFHDRVY